MTRWLGPVSVSRDSDVSRLPALPAASIRRWPYALLGAAVGAAAVIAAQQLLDSGSPQAVATEEVALATAEVTTGDLLEEVDWDGEIAYSDTTTLTGTGGVVTSSRPVGTVVEPGESIVEIDAEPVVLLTGSIPAYRTMSRDVVGPDVLVLEQNLTELGYDSDGTVTVDETFTYYTELMVERWQDDIGAEVTGVVDPDQILVMDGAVVLLTEPTVGSSAVGPVVTLARQSDLGITVPVAVADADEFNPGDAVIVLLADESELAGTVAVVGTDITTDQGGSTVDISIEVDGGTEGLVEGPVVVRSIGEEIRDAIVVPTRALVALAEGGFAVEKVDGGEAQLVGIEIGAFDDGLVEVVAGDLVPGDLVVVPQ